MVEDIGGNLCTNWLSNLSNEKQSIQLVRQQNTSNGKSFSNQAEYLLISQQTIDYLTEFCDLNENEIIQRFRPNFVIDSRQFGDEWKPFEEDSIKELYIGSIPFEVRFLYYQAENLLINNFSSFWII